MMRRKTKRTIGGFLLGIGIALMLGSLPCIGSAKNMATPHWYWFLLIAAFSFVGGAFLGRWGARILDSTEAQSSFEIFQVKPVKPQATLSEFFDPWVKAPKVKVKKEKDEIPEIWKEKILARG